MTFSEIFEWLNLPEAVKGWMGYRQSFSFAFKFCLTQKEVASQLNVLSSATCFRSIRPFLRILSPRKMPKVLLKSIYSPVKIISQFVLLGIDKTANFIPVPSGRFMTLLSISIHRKSVYRYRQFINSLSLHPPAQANGRPAFAITDLRKNLTQSI
jgi:hypothetical protein